MKTNPHFHSWLLIVVFILTACAPAALSTPPPATATVVPTEIPLPTETPTPIASATPPGSTYVDQSTGFQLTYPAGWNLDPNKPIGSRATQALLLSPGTTAETLAEGGTRIAIVVYSWDPKNDLAAYLDHRKAAWEASGNKIVEENDVTLAGDRPAVGLILQGTDNQQNYLLITTASEKYLEIVGVGDLALSQEIAMSLSPVSP
jgi:hypothetical protein